MPSVSAKLGVKCQRTFWRRRLTPQSSNAQATRCAGAQQPSQLPNNTILSSHSMNLNLQVMKRAVDYEGLTQEFIWRLLSCASFTEERFAEVMALARECDW